MRAPMTGWGGLARAAAWVVSALVTVWVAYVAAAGVILSPWAMGKVFESSQDIKLDRARAWSLWPGVVTAHDVRLRMQDQNIEWLIELDEARFTMSLTELARHTIHMTRVRGDGVVFRFRSRVLPEEAESPTVAGYPPVPPYADPPIAPAYVASRPIPEEEYHLWTLHIEDVDVGVREMWLHEVRYLATGELGRARGAFREALESAFADYARSI